MFRSTLAATLSLIWLLHAAALDAKEPTGKGPCRGADDCHKGVCLQINADSYCSQTCGNCPAGMYCDDQLFGMLNLKVCAKGSDETPAKIEKEPPKLPCKTDKQCPGGLVCAEFMGNRDCTRECKVEEECKMPEMMGMKIDFMSCQVDEGKRTRQACLPKRECLANPMSCMSLNPQTMGAMAGGMMAMGNAFEAAAGGGPAGAAPSPYASPTPTPGYAGGGASPQPAAPVAMAMSEGRFSDLLAQVKKEAFQDGREGVIKLAAESNYFDCAQVGRVIDVIAMSDEKVSALEILAPRLVDRENGYTIIGHFTFDDDKKKAKKILAR